MRLQLPANVALRLAGTIRCRGSGFVLEMDDLDARGNPVVREFLLADDRSGTGYEMQRFVDVAVTIDGRWQPDPAGAVGSGWLKVFRVLEGSENAAEDS